MTTPYDIVNACRNLLVDKLFEPSENELIIDLIAGEVSELSQSLNISQTDIGPVYPVNFDSGALYRLHFTSYIAYHVVNESYDAGVFGEYDGDRIRVYTKSSYLTYCRNETLGFQLNSESSIRHYVVVTARHIINVITCSDIHVSEIK